MKTFSTSNPNNQLQQQQTQQKQVRKIKKNVKSDKYYQIAQEKEVMILEKYAKLKIGADIRIENVEFNYKGKQTFIHSLINGEKNKECLVLIHGYLASSLFYYKIIKRFSQIYKVISIDLLGMGLSDRQRFDDELPKNYDNATKIFIESFEEWRKALGLEKFILAGHSFGGFISFNYYLHYPQHVQQLYLISPMIVSKVQKEEDLRGEKEFEEFTSQLKFKASLFPKFMRYMHNKRATLSTFLQTWFIPSDYFINKIIDQRFNFESENEKKDWKEYFKSIQFLPESTDHLIYEFVYMPYVQPKISIEEICEQNKFFKYQIPIHFFYGNYDWNDYSGAVRLLKSQQLIGTLRFVKNACHLIPFEQPDSLANLMYEQMKYNQNVDQLQKQQHHNDQNNNSFSQYCYV